MASSPEVLLVEDETAMAHLERPLTVLTTLLAPMLAAIGSAYGIHMVSRYQEEAAHAPDGAGAGPLR